jgi:hypothetical protein
MFNRKITAESFDDSLDSFEDFLQDPHATKDLSNKSKTNEAASVDLETGEVFSTSTRTTPAPKIQRENRSTTKTIRKEQMSEKEALTHYLPFIIPVGTSLMISLIVCIFAYWVYSTEFSRVNLEVVQMNAKISVLDHSIRELQTNISPNDETEEVFNELERLTDHLENIEKTLQVQLQNAPKQAISPTNQKVSPIDSLKNVSYLGFFGTTEQPTALISVKNERKELTTGQFLIHPWQVIAIYPHQITLSHTNGMIQTINRKKSLF